MARLLIFVALLCLAAAAQAKVVTNERLIKLNQTSVNDAIKALGPDEGMLIQFYIPGCNFCKAMVEEWLVFVDTDIPNVKPAVANCQVDQLFCRYWGITEAPTVLFLKNNQLYEFTGDRTAEELVAFVEEDYLRSPRREMPQMVAFDEIEKALAQKEKRKAEQTGFDVGALLKGYSSSTITMVMAALVTTVFILLGYCCAPAIEEEEKPVTKKKENKENKPEKVAEKDTETGDAKPKKRKGKQAE